jgi:NAD dependent epimerase/dehydratase family enzyme
VRRVVVRLGDVLSRDGGYLAPLYRGSLRFTGRLGSGQQYVSWVHVDDVGYAMLHLIADASASGTYNVCAPQPVRSRDLLAALHGITRRPGFMSAADSLLRMRYGDGAAIFLDSRRATPDRLLAAGYPFRYPQLAPALRHLFQRRRRR